MDLQQLRSWIFELYEPLENERQYVVFDAERGNLLIDVPPYSERALRLLRGAGRASLLLVTNRERAVDAHRYREALGVQVVAHADDASAIKGGPDLVLSDDELLRPDARALRVDGSTVLLVRKAGGVLICGDLDLASPGARALAERQFSAVLSARRAPVWNAGRDDLLRLHHELPKPTKRFGLLLQAPWSRSHRGRLEDQMKPNALIPTDRTVDDQAAMGPATLVVARASRDLIERPARPAWDGARAEASAPPLVAAPGRERPRNFQEDWSAPASSRPPTTLANAARDIQPVTGAVASPAGPQVGEIDLSSDGAEIVFARTTGNGTSEICGLPLDGDRIFQLTDAGARSIAPRWSPDLKRIAFLRGAVDRLALWIVDRDGKTEHQLAAGPFLDFAWSPDGASIACGSVSGIQVVHVETGASRSVTTGTASEPRWSPDGSTIAYTRGVVGSRGCSLVPAAGGLATDLSIGGEAFQAEWSPEGSRLACTVVVDGKTRIAVVMLAGSAVASIQRFGNSPFAESRPQWRPDGRALIYLQDQGGGTVIVRRVFVASHTDTPVADRPGTHASPRVGPDSETLVYVLGNTLWVQGKGRVEPRRLT